MFPSCRSEKDFVGIHSLEFRENYKNNDSVDSQAALHRADSHLTVDYDTVTEVCDLPLERCMRILPHDQNGGAFFIAVFQKYDPLPGD